MKTIEKTPPAKDNIRISFRLTPSLLAKLRMCARVEGMTVNEFIVRELEKAALAAERGIPTEPIAPLLTYIRIDDEETCRQLAIEAATLRRWRLFCAVRTTAYTNCLHPPSPQKLKSPKPLRFRALKVVAGRGFEPLTFRL